MRIYACCVGLVLLFQVHSFSQCLLTPNPQFKPFRGVENKASGHFEWYSATGDNPTQGGGHPSNVFERRVTNLGTTTLKYDWQIGRMYNNALAAGKPDLFCHEYDSPNQKDGPLDYGRGNEKADTTVWEGAHEPVKAVVSAFTFNIQETDDVRIISIQVLSWAQPTIGGGFSYKYALNNLGGNEVRVEWDITQDRPLLQALRQQDLTPAFDIGRGREISLQSPLPPVTRFRGVNIIVNNRRMAGAQVPVFLPK